MIDYTGREIVPKKKFDNIVLQHEMKRVKTLPKGGPWIQQTRLADKFWELDDVSFLPQVGKKTKEKLKEVLDIEFIKELSSITDDKISIFPINQHSPLTCSKLRKLRDSAKSALPGSCPHQPIDHRTAENPYLSRFGEEN